MAKKLIILSLSVVVFGLSFSAYAQTPSQQSASLQEMIRQLQEQIKALQVQIVELKTEIQEVRVELRITRSLQRGEKGEEVEQLQGFLKRFPDIYPEGLVTGYFGQRTEEAVKRFQEQHGVEPIGIVGPKTREKLLDEAERLNKSPVETPSGTIPAEPAIPATRAVPQEAPAHPAERAVPAQPVKQYPSTLPPSSPEQTDRIISEQVKCVFKGSTTVQECIASANYGGVLTCKGTETCIADVKGYNGEKLTWKSSCGGYAYTTVDGVNEYAEFSCGTTQTVPVLESQPLPAPAPVSLLLPCDTSTPRPSGYITYDVCSDQEPVVIRRANGDLVAVFNSGGTGFAGLRSAVSQDNGKTWSEPKVAYNSWDDIGLTEGAGGQLVLLARAESGDFGIITLTSNDGITWSNPRKVTPTAINNEAGSIMYSKDGYYYVSYSNATDFSSDVYVTRSKDLVNWESPAAVTQGGSADFDSSLIQTADGIFYLAHTSYTDGSTVVSSSQDARSWSAVHKVLGGASAHNGVNLIEVNGKPVLFVNQNGNTGYTYPDSGGWIALKNILSGTPFGVDAAVMSNGSIGLAYAYIAYYASGAEIQRDIRFADVGVLNIGTTVASGSNANLAAALASLSVLLNSTAQLLERIR